MNTFLIVLFYAALFCVSFQISSYIRRIDVAIRCIANTKYTPKINDSTYNCWIFGASITYIVFALITGIV